MQRGTDIHAEQQHYLETGEIRDSSYGGLNFRPYLEALIPHLPPPRHPELLVEQHIELDTPLGPGSWIGFIDAAWSENDPVLVLDLKTTSDFRYAKTPKELMDNIQMMSYAKWAYTIGHDGWVKIAHLYVKTGKKVPKKPKVKYVDVDVNRNHVEERWDKAMLTVVDMQKASLVDCANDLPPTTTACGMYGGCQHRASCGLVGEGISLAGRFKKKNEKGKENMANAFLSNLKKGKDKKPPNGASTNSEAKTEAKAETKKAAKKKGGFLSRLTGGKKPKTTEDKDKGVLPPDAPSRTTPVEAKDEAPAETETAAKPETSAKPETAEKKKKARKKKGFHLYIDCVPVKGEKSMVMFEDWMAPIFKTLNETVLEEKKLPSYLLLGYSEEKAMFSLALTSRIEDVPGVLVINSSTPGAKDALGVLIPHAAKVVRAMR